MRLKFPFKGGYTLETIIELAHERGEKLYNES